ncbi:hypothetical protein [Mesomycoplasma hyorhinis]|nr:hypothetical protein NV227_00965 [Mesomycoplasma hyorhinis]
MYFKIATLNEALIDKAKIYKEKWRKNGRFSIFFYKKIIVY